MNSYGTMTLRKTELQTIHMLIDDLVTFCFYYKMLVHKLKAA
jgi:hypothetical protein